MINASPLSVGFVPVSFPRDPVEFNQYDEHVIAGQILEPLVEADGEGKISPSVAKEWHYSKDGLQIDFLIDSNKFFSNGKQVTADDVVYSLKRHMNSNSQSKGFLSFISGISTLSSSKVRIQLKQKNVSILKALTRDQLGIVPNGWTFDTNSKRPYVGTGPYNLEKIGEFWFLIVNPLFTSFNVPVEKWKLVFYTDDKFTPPENIPDLLPSITASVLEKIKANHILDKEGFKLEVLLSFTQTSLWTDPRGQLYNSVEKRKEAQSFMNELIIDFVNSNNFQRSTGMIPIGIEGSLNVIPQIPEFKRKHLREIRIASLGGIFAKYFTDEKIKQIKEKYGIRVLHQNFSFLELKSLGNWKADYIAGGWAGGFNDPSGFLGLLNVIFGMPFKEYLESLGPDLSKTEMEDDRGKRIKDFQNLGENVIKNGLMTPGWRLPMYEVANSKVQNIQFQTRYTPRLVNYRASK